MGNANAINAPAVGAPVRAVPNPIPDPHTRCFTIDPGTIEHDFEPALCSFGGLRKHGLNYPRRFAEQATGQVDQMNQVVEQAAEKLVQAEHKVRDANFQLQETLQTVETTGRKMKTVAGIAGGGITCAAAIARLAQTIRQLKYGPESEHRAKDIRLRVDTMLIMRDALPLPVCNLLEDLGMQTDKLIEDIRMHYRGTNGIRAVGAVAGAAGGACTVASFCVKGADKASSLAKVGGGLVLGFAGAEVVTGVADWFTDHHERLRHLSAQLAAIKETVALVRVPVPDVSGDRNEARVEAQEVAMNLLDIAKSIKNGDF